MNNTRKLILLALMVSQALVLSIIESWIPFPFVFPGVKLGLANIVTMVVIMFFGLKETLLVVIVRVILSSIFTGGFAVFWFSITGGILSALVMAMLYYRFSKLFSTVGISVAGSIAHNIGQIIVASFYMRELTVFTYLPVLMVSGIIMGVFVGTISMLLAGALKSTNLL